jgi:hypothetical protein
MRGGETSKGLSRLGPAVAESNDLGEENGFGGERLPELEVCGWHQVRCQRRKRLEVQEAQTDGTRGGTCAMGEDTVT